MWSETKHLPFGFLFFPSFLCFPNKNVHLIHFCTFFQFSPIEKKSFEWGLFWVGCASVGSPRFWPRITINHRHLGFHCFVFRPSWKKLTNKKERMKKENKTINIEKKNEAQRKIRNGKMMKVKNEIGFKGKRKEERGKRRQN